MSYALGLQAFQKRFIKRFPEPEYRYVLSMRETINDAPHIFTELSSCNFGGNYQEIDIYHRASDEKIVEIDGNITFGIRLRVKSSYLKDGLYLTRRPLNLIRANQHGMRHYLFDKPKFAKLASSLASQIHFAFAKACTECKLVKRAINTLCHDCHQNEMHIGNMMNEGSPYLDDDREEFSMGCYAC